MATSNREIVNRAMDKLMDGLNPFVEREMAAAYGEGWFAGAQAAFRRAVRCRSGTAGPLAARKLRGKAAVVLRLNPNPVEERRIGSHREIMRGSGGAVQDLTAGK